MKIGQHITNKDGEKYQIRRLKTVNGELMLGIGRKGVCWLFAKDWEVYKKKQN